MPSENGYLTGRVRKSKADLRKAVEEYKMGRVSVGKAAEMAGISIAEFYRILKNEDIAIRVDIAGIKQ
jgi:predicted HTH domain antitoxin